MIKKVLIVLICLLSFNNEVYASDYEVGDGAIDNSEVKKDSVDYDISKYYFLFTPKTNKRLEWVDIYIDGKYAYCLEPNVLFNGKYEWSTIDPLKKFTKEDWKYLSLLTMFAQLRYDKTSNLAYRFAAQTLIHEYVDPSGGNRIIQYYANNKLVEYPTASYKQELKKLVADYYVLPKFNLLDTYFTNHKYELVDENNVLHKYDVVSNNLDYVVDDNKLIVSSSSPGKYYIELEEFTKYANGSVFYWFNNRSQDLIEANGYLKHYLNLELDFIDQMGSLVVNKYDQVSKLGLGGVKFKLERLEGDDVVLISDRLITDDQGKIFVDDLKLGNYVLTELSTITNYEINDKPVYFKIKENSQVVDLDIFNSKILLTTGNPNILTIFVWATVMLWGFKLLILRK